MAKKGFRVLCLGGPLVGLINAPAAGQMNFVEDAAQGTVTVTDGGVPVLTYRFGDRVEKGVDARFIRSCYIHPLYALDGRGTHF